MSSSKKVTSSIENGKVAVPMDKAKNSSDASSKKPVLKRSVEDSSELRDWKPLNHQVFVTRGLGFLREKVTVKTGEEKDVFAIVGICADDKVFVLQVWGTNARMIAELFKRFAEPDFEPTLWIYPVPAAKGLYFREGKANDYQKNSYGASFAVSLEYGKGETGPFSGRMSTAAFPSMFAWQDGNFAVNGVRIPHFSKWGQVPDSISEAGDVPDDYIPPTRTYEEVSPQKSRRTDVQQSASSNNGRATRPTDLTFEEED